MILYPHRIDTRLPGQQQSVHSFVLLFNLKCYLLLHFVQYIAAGSVRYKINHAIYARDLYKEFEKLQLPDLQLISFPLSFMESQVDTRFTQDYSMELSYLVSLLVYHQKIPHQLISCETQDMLIIWLVRDCLSIYITVI